MQSLLSLEAILILIVYAEAFEVIWNGPLSSCAHFNIHLNFTKYGIKSNYKDAWIGPDITIFYKDHMGLYPSISSSHTEVNGGIPQKVNITAHEDRCRADINEYIPDEQFDGLGVIDYESWRPLWARDYDAMAIYRNLSKGLVQEQHPDWSYDMVTREAKVEFEDAARKFLTVTLITAKTTRPRGKWGYYLYPNCGYDYNRTCLPVFQNFNDQLLWLFNTSSALYPSGYLSYQPEPNLNRDFIYKTVTEAKRVRDLVTTRGSHLPIYLYSRITYRDYRSFYSKSDLKNSIYQACQLGIDGVVLWESSEFGEDQGRCSDLKMYLDSMLGPFVWKILHDQRYGCINTNNRRRNHQKSDFKFNNHRFHHRHDRRRFHHL